MLTLIRILLGAALLIFSCHSPRAGVIERVSVANDGTQGNGDSGYWGLAISADGHFVAFSSTASNLVPGDSNQTSDVFVSDRLSGTIERVSVASDGTQGNEWSGDWGLCISANGRYVAFSSLASNLVPGDTSGHWDIFVRDRQMGITERVSVASDGKEANSDSYWGLAITADGRYVAFASRASNLVPGDTNGDWDVFVHDRQTGMTERASVASDGTQGNSDSGNYGVSMSADGRYVAFASLASNLVPGDTNGDWDAFVHDRQAGMTERASVASDGTQGNSDSGNYGVSMSADGRYVVFNSYASNLLPGDTNETCDTFVHDRVTGATERVSVGDNGTQGNDWSGDYGLSVSAEGRYVAFASMASNLVPGDTNETWDAFVRDRWNGTTERVSVASDATEANSCSYFGLSLSADGRYVAFMSNASNLVIGDTNEVDDAFVRDRGTTLPALAAGIRIADQTADELRQNGCHFFVSGEAGLSYVVEYSADLMLWTTLQTVHATAPEVEVADYSMTEAEHRFYRVRLLQ
jgi:Tol biopolymer transport system component